MAFEVRRVDDGDKARVFVVRYPLGTTEGRANYEIATDICQSIIERAQKNEPVAIAIPQVMPDFEGEPPVQWDVRELCFDERTLSKFDAIASAAVELFRGQRAPTADSICLPFNRSQMQKLVTLYEAVKAAGYEWEELT
jgi:hypothetical protein